MAGVALSGSGGTGVTGTAIFEIASARILLSVVAALETEAGGRELPARRERGLRLGPGFAGGFGLTLPGCGSLAGDTADEVSVGAVCAAAKISPNVPALGCCREEGAVDAAVAG